MFESTGVKNLNRFADCRDDTQTDRCKTLFAPDVLSEVTTRDEHVVAPTSRLAASSVSPLVLGPPADQRQGRALYPHSGCESWPTIAVDACSRDCCLR